MLCSVWRLAVWRCTQMRSFFHGRLCKWQEMTLLLVLLVSQQPQSTPAGLFDRCILLLSWARQTQGLHSVWSQASAGFSLQVEGWASWRPSSSWQVESSWGGEVRDLLRSVCRHDEWLWRPGLCRLWEGSLWWLLWILVEGPCEFGWPCHRAGSWIDAESLVLHQVEVAQPWVRAGNRSFWIIMVWSQIIWLRMRERL